MSRVLVAEDDPEMRRLVAEALRKDGHEILEASDGAQMLVLLAENSTGITGWTPSTSS